LKSDVSVLISKTTMYSDRYKIFCRLHSNITSAEIAQIM